MSLKYKITIDGKVRVSNSLKEHNQLIKCKKIADFLQGNNRNYDDAAAEFNYSSVEALKVALKNAGLTKAKPIPSELLKINVITAINRHQKGESIIKIASEYNVSPQRLCGRMKILGYSMKGKSYKKDKRNHDRILYSSALSLI